MTKRQGYRTLELSGGRIRQQHSPCLRRMKLLLKDCSPAPLMIVYGASRINNVLVFNSTKAGYSQGGDYSGCATVVKKFQASDAKKIFFVQKIVPFWNQFQEPERPVLRIMFD